MREREKIASITGYFRVLNSNIAVFDGEKIYFNGGGGEIEMHNISIQGVPKKGGR